MAFTDYYELLQISSTAESDIISAAYKRLAMKYHPDTNGPDSSDEMMKLLNEAWAVLGDPASRTNYQYVWEQERKKKDRIRVVKFLLDHEKYEEAKEVLIGLDHPIAYKCLIQIDKILARQRVKQYEAAREAQGAAGAYPYDAPPQPHHTNIDDLANQRIQKIRRRQEERESAQQQEITRQVRERQKAKAYRDVLIRTYEKVGVYAFQWDDLDAADAEEEAEEQVAFIPKNKEKAWDAIMVTRYELARSEIGKSPDADQNMLDWSLLIDHILDTETAGQRLRRLGFKGFLNYPLGIRGIQTSLLGWIILLVALTLILGYLAPTFAAFIGVVVVAVICLLGMVIKFLTDR